MSEDNLKKIKLQLSQKGLSPTIIGVSKKQPVEKIWELQSRGLLNFGENYLQEAQKKIEASAGRDISWHFIGGLQRKKVKEVLGLFDWIHSVDRVDLAEKISSVAIEKGIVQKVLLQVNIAKEDSKGGVPPDEIESFMRTVLSLKGLSVRGLMVFPPLEEDEKITRKWCRMGKTLLEDIQSKMGSEISELSMGTSSDFLIAAEEGATMIRLGEILMGPREPKALI